MAKRLNVLGYIWSKLSLAQQFALASIIVILPGAIAVGWWVPDRINEAIIRNSAAGTILYMEGLITPLVPKIGGATALDAETRKGLDKVLHQTRAAGKLISIKIWRFDGTVLYSSFPDIIGKKFEPSETFLIAREGGMGVSFNETAHAEDLHEKQSGVPLLEVYAPVRDPYTQNIVAISEFYADGTETSNDIREVTRLSWLVVGAAASSLIGVLSFIVAKASSLITTQQRQLHQQVDDLNQLLAQNEELRLNLQQSNERASSINEKILQRVGADLHDGPAQLLAYVMLRFSRIKKLFTGHEEGSRTLDEVSKIILETLRNVRHLSTGLMLPELANLDLGQVVEQAAKMHEDLTSTPVKIDNRLVHTSGSEALKMCVFRFVQESLTNSYKHAGGANQTITLRWSEGIEISVADGGPGMSDHKSSHAGLGLIGMRSRIEAIGGTLQIKSSSGTGTCVTAHFPDSIGGT